MARKLVPTALGAVALAMAAAAVLLPVLAVAQPSDDLPGVDVSELTQAQRAVFDQIVARSFCYCGCPHTVAGCLREHRSCKHAPRMARLAARLAAQGLSVDEARKALTDYYAGFDRAERARLDVKDFGPPRGNADAPVQIVEFSDFTCPFCQRLEPELDRFVAAHPDRVRLYYKPFPIASHPRALEAAIAGEWARDHGLFWKMYAQLFANPGALEDEDLAGYAAAVGGDPDDLRRALETGRDRPRIAASQAEARAAGIKGTPTLFFNGRRLDLPWGRDVQGILEFTVEDEVEWAAHGGWTRD